MKRQLNTRIEESLARRLYGYADASGAAVTAIVDAALVEYLDVRSDPVGWPLMGRSPLPKRLQRRAAGRPVKGSDWARVVGEREWSMRRRVGRRTSFARMSAL
jgi:hypothetical protein